MKCSKSKCLHIITYILIIVGALNWGLVGLFGFDLVATLFGDGSGLSRVIYSLVGIAAVVDIISHKKKCSDCGSCATCSSSSDSSMNSGESISREM